MAPLTSIDGAKRLVVKIGSALLVDAVSGSLRLEWLKSLALDVAAAKRAGQDVVIVSSGSIALGRRVLGLPAGALSLEQSQAAAAVGQIRLARAYEEALAPHDLNTAQVLLTLDDSTNRRRYLNSRATFATLLGFGVVPIVNENDTVATDEIRYGDNDRLAAQVAVMAGADLVILLSDVDGLYTANPLTDPEARHLAHIDKITPAIEAMGGDAINAASKGGMKTKLMAARTATAGTAFMEIAALRDGETVAQDVDPAFAANLLALAFDSLDFNENIYRHLTSPLNVRIISPRRGGTCLSPVLAGYCVSLWHSWAGAKPCSAPRPSLRAGSVA